MLKNSKIGLHIIEPYRKREYDQAVVNARPGVIKVVGDTSELGILDYWHSKLGNSTIYIARIYPYCKAIEDMMSGGKSPKEAADVMFAALSTHVTRSGMHWCYYEAGPNEPGDDRLVWIDDYYSLIVPRLRAAGIKSVSYNFSVCHPPIADWRILSGSLEAIKTAGCDWALVGLHQYGLCGNMQDYADTRVLRHRNIPQLSKIPIILTESGLDSPGWQCTDQGTDGYFADLAWLDYELRKDDNILGACIYTMDNAPSWEAFRIEGELAQRIFKYMTEQNAIIEIYPEDDGINKQYIVIANKLNVRAGAGVQYAKIGTLKAGDRISVRKIEDGWAEIVPIVNNYISMQYLKEIK
jgi:hypothetical protein